MIAYQTDLDIIIFRKQYRKYIQSYDPTGSVWIGDTCYKFRMETLFNGRLRVYLPEQFADMPDSSAKVKYPSRNRPSIIKTNENATVDFTFSFIGENQFRLTAQTVWNEIEYYFPRNVLYDTGTFTKENQEIFWLEYKSFSMESEVYNLLFTIVFGNTDTKSTILGAFNCAFASYDIWKPCVLQIIEAIQCE